MNYRMQTCVVHGNTLFGPYFASMTELADGCLKCHWATTPDCPNDDAARLADAGRMAA